MYIKLKMPFLLYFAKCLIIVNDNNSNLADHVVNTLKCVMAIFFLNNLSKSKSSDMTKINIF